MFLSDLIGSGEVIDRVHDLDKSINFLKMILFLSFLVVARIINPNIFLWLAKQGFNLGATRDFNSENPEKYILSVSMLLIFSVLSVGIYLSQIGVYANYNSPVLINLAITVFFFTIFLVVVNFLQSVLFSIRNVFNIHFIDLLNYLFIIGTAAFIALLSNWFLQDSIAMFIQSGVLVFLFVVFVIRMFRLLLKGDLIFGQNVVLIFFYLCAAEISPFLIVGKLLTNLV